MRVTLCCLAVLLLFSVSCQRQGKGPDKCALPPGSTVCSINANNECDYNIDNGTSMDVALNHGKGQNIHFHSTKEFSVSVALDSSADPSCTQGCDPCPFTDNKCNAENTKNVVLGPVTKNYPGHSCRYSINIGITQPPKDPNLIVH